MIPPLSRRVISLQTPVLDREQIVENALLDHRLAEQPASIAGTSAQLLTRGLHTLILTLELEFLLTALLRLQQLPGAVDGPVPEVAVAGEAKRAGCYWVVKEVADEGCRHIVLAFIMIQSCRWGSCGREDIGRPQAI